MGEKRGQATNSSFERFALAFGLAEREGWPRDIFSFHLEGDWLIRKTSLLDQFLEFLV